MPSTLKKRLDDHAHEYLVGAVLLGVLMPAGMLILVLAVDQTADLRLKSLYDDGELMLTAFLLSLTPLLTLVKGSPTTAAPNRFQVHAYAGCISLIVTSVATWAIVVSQDQQRSSISGARVETGREIARVLSEQKSVPVDLVNTMLQPAPESAGWTPLVLGIIYIFWAAAGGAYILTFAKAAD